MVVQYVRRSFNRGVTMIRELRGALTAGALLASAVLAIVSLRLELPMVELVHSLRFHFAAVLLGLVVLLFATQSWWRGALFVVVLLASLADGGYMIWRQQAARAFAGAAEAVPLLRLVSFNTLQVNEANGPRIADFFLGSGADVIAVMEAGAIAGEAARLATVYPYRVGCDAGGPCDTALMSKTPLTDVTVRAMSPVWRNRLIVAKTVVGGQGVTIVVAHMVKPYFDDFPYLESHVMAQVIRQLDGPVLLAGDFNAAAWSPNIDWLRREAGLVPGPGYPATWPVRLGPLGVPIDNVWTRAPLLITHIEAMGDAMGSNHRGLISEIAIAR